MRIISGIKVLAEIVGAGALAEKGDEVKFRCAGTLRDGSVVHDRRKQETRLGSRRLIPGVEKSLLGMRVGGYRKVRISPHLAYGDRGVPEQHIPFNDQGLTAKIPPGAVLDYELWLMVVRKPDPPVLPSL